jgi:hypothetical protein
MRSAGTELYAVIIYAISAAYMAHAARNLLPLKRITERSPELIKG